MLLPSIHVNHVVLREGTNLLRAVIFRVILILAGFLFAIGMLRSQDPGIPADSYVFVDWAMSCELVRGPGIIGFPDSIEVFNGGEEQSLGKADNITLSLGDGGSATLFFREPFGEGPGPDFAVFENSFDGKFLELAHVEVSSDGENFIRFPSRSLTQVEEQVGTYETLDATELVNLAGRHRALVGTPFDLAELADSGGLDLHSISAVRIIDVIGILNDSLGSRDADGRLINDPYPTPFETGGFDLDAVGILDHSLMNLQTSASTFHSALDDQQNLQLKVYPNPFTEFINLEFQASLYREVEVMDMYGRVVLQQVIPSAPSDRARTGIIEMDLSHLLTGTYLIRCTGQQDSKSILIRKSGNRKY